MRGKENGSCAGGVGFGGSGRVCWGGEGRSGDAEKVWRQRQATPGQVLPVPGGGFLLGVFVGTVFAGVVFAGVVFAEGVFLRGEALAAWGRPGSPRKSVCASAYPPIGRRGSPLWKIVFRGRGPGYRSTPFGGSDSLPSAFSRSTGSLTALADVLLL